MRQKSKHYELKMPKHFAEMNDEDMTFDGGLPCRFWVGFTFQMVSGLCTCVSVFSDMTETQRKSDFWTMIHRGSGIAAIVSFSLSTYLMISGACCRSTTPLPKGDPMGISAGATPETPGIIQVETIATKK